MVNAVNINSALRLGPSKSVGSPSRESPSFCPQKKTRQENTEKGELYYAQIRSCHHETPSIYIYIFIYVFVNLFWTYLYIALLDETRTTC